MAIAASFVMISAAPVAAQGVFGHLYDSETGLAVANADVMMTDAAGDTVGRALSDENGRFLISVRDPGDYLISVSRLGYVSQANALIKVEGVALQTLEMLIDPEAVGIDGLVVSAERRVASLVREGFYERKRNSLGEFIQPTEVELRQVFEPSGLLRGVPGIEVTDGIVSSTRGGVGFATGCILKVLVDGVDRGVDLDEAVNSRHITAIEVYKSIEAVPGRFLGTVTSGAVIGFDTVAETCGAVVVWTKRGGDRNRSR